MRLHAALLLALLAATRLTPAQVCAPTTQLARQFRTAMKHRAPGPTSDRAVTFAELAAWPSPGGVAEYRVRSADGPIDPREQAAVTLEGDLWRVVVEANDCDLHLDLAAPGGGVDAPRVIAEAPAGPGYEAARAAVLAAIRLPSARARDRVDLATPVRVRLTGYGFWDGAQWCRRDGVRGGGHATDAVATIWELHRVWRVELVETASPSRPTGPGAPAATSEPSTDAHAGRVVCSDGWTSACACGHPPGMGCCRGHRGECGVCRGSR